MGGTVAKLAGAGATIYSVVLTDGSRSPNPFGWTPAVMASVRQQEAVRAAKVLGVQEHIALGLPDITAADNYQSAKSTLKELLIGLKPSEFYLLHPKLDRHPTHQLSGYLALESIGEARPPDLREIWAYEVWGLFSSWDRIEYIDNEIAKKLLAVAQHKSQIAQVPYGEAVQGLNRWRAVFADPKQHDVCGVYAEVFKLITV